jgi:4-amino-4-deoxy-L-arabinose transferase-like glycosyltransferase
LAWIVNRHKETDFEGLPMVETPATAKTEPLNDTPLLYSAGSVPAVFSEFQKKARRFDIFAGWLLLTSVNLFYHHLIPLDETRYAAVAWEMWNRHDFLVPHLNGVPYHHKPPLLFWLYNLGWSLFGVNELWLLLISPLCGLVSLYWVRYMAYLLWPGHEACIRMAPRLLMGSLIWGAFMNGAMFDTLLGLCVLLAMTGLIKASRTQLRRHWTLFALGCGLGLLTKGPAIFVYILVPFLLGKLWSETAKAQPGHWYLLGVLAILAGIALALCWAIPAVQAGGDGYGGTLLWHQTVNRMVNSFAHRRPIGWYIMWAPVILFPWFFWPRLWRQAFRSAWLKDTAFRFCLIWFVSGFVGFSLISGKQIHYLLPLMPALALLLSRMSGAEKFEFRPGDLLPYLVIGAAGILLLILPAIPDLKLYHWLANRKVWWAWIILSIGLVGIVFSLKTRRTAAYHYSLAVVLGLAGSLAGFFSSAGNAYNLQSAVRPLSAYFKDGEPLVWAGKYDGQFEFLMRLEAPLTVIKTSEIGGWLDQHPNGHVIFINSTLKIETRRFKIDYAQPYREDRLIVLSRKNL